LRPPAGPGWIHEIKHDGFRILAKQNPDGVHLFTRKGYDLAVRFPLATTAIAALPARSCLIDGEAIARDQNGLAVFEMIRWRRHDQDVVLCAFDLLELNGQDLRKAPIEERKRTLAKLLRRSPAGITFNEHYEGDGTTLFQHVVSSAVKGSYRNGLVHPTARAA
jgi:ATP-dependent DNA ligase